MFITTALRHAQEEPEKLSRHAEIGRRYAWDDRQRQYGRRPRSFALLRLRELERFYAVTYGPTLPDDDAGRAELFNAAQHIGQGGAIEQHFPAWASLWAPWAGADECDEIIARVVARPERWTADTLAWRIGLNDATRTRLMITSIGSTDVGKAERAKRRRERDAAAHRERRALAASGRNRPLPTSRLRPWEAAGVSRATWYRRRSAETEIVRQDPTTAEVTYCCRRGASHQGDVASAIPAFDAAGALVDQDGDARRAALDGRPRQTLYEFFRIIIRHHPADRCGDIAVAFAAFERCIEAGYPRGLIANSLAQLAYAALVGEDVPQLSDVFLSLITHRERVTVGNTSKETPQ